VSVLFIYIKAYKIALFYFFNPKYIFIWQGWHDCTVLVTRVPQMLSIRTNSIALCSGPSVTLLVWLTCLWSLTTVWQTQGDGINETGEVNFVTSI